MKPTKTINSNKTFLKCFNSSFFQDSLLTIFILFVMIIIISNPTIFTEGTISGLKLFVFSVLPGLLPFMLLTKLLTEIGTVFKITKKMDKFSYAVFGTPGVSLYAFFMSILSGYPIGAKIISDLYSKNLINEENAKKMSIFCTTSGPVFVIGTVGSIMFKSFKFGLILYFSHILSSIFLGILANIFNKLKTKNQNFSKNTTIQNSVNFSKNANILNYCVSETINSLFIVGAYITIFYLVSELLDVLNIFNFITYFFSSVFNKLGINLPYFKETLYGIVEVTRGCKSLSLHICKETIILASALISFSGISIIMQSMAFLKNAKIKTHNFILTKVVHSFFSALICYILVVMFIWNNWNFNIVNCFFKFITISSNHI